MTEGPIDDQELRWCLRRVKERGTISDGRGFVRFKRASSRWVESYTLPDHPLLPAVARWLDELGGAADEVLLDLIDAGVFCLDEGGAIEFDDPRRKRRAIQAGRALLAGLD